MKGRNLDHQMEIASKEIIRRLKELQFSNDWIQNGNEPCLLYKMDVGERVASKGIKILDFPFQTVVEFLKKEESFAKINPYLKEMQIPYQKLEPLIHYKIIYAEFNGIWPIDNRDFVNLGIGFPEGENKIYIGSKAFDYPIPEKEGVVRAQIYLGAYIMERIDKNRTKLTYINDADLKGSLPNFVKGIVNEYQGRIPYQVSLALKKEQQCCNK